MIGDIARGERLPENIAKVVGVPGTSQVGKSIRTSNRKGKVQGLLPQQLPEDAGELYRVLMGQYEEPAKKRKRRSGGLSGY